MYAVAQLGVGFRCSPRPLRPLGLVRVAGRLNPPLVIVTIVVTGNHFVLDAVAGSAVLCAGLLAVGWVGDVTARPDRACALRERRQRVSFATMDAASRGGAAR